MVRLKAALCYMMTAAIAHAAPRIPDEIAKHATERVDQGYCIGLVIGVVDDGGAVFLSRGVFDKKSNRPVDENTLFEIGSATKAFTGILLADMVERKLVSLDDPVQKLLPGSAKVPTRGDKQITLRDLATHRSGLPRMPDNFDPADPRNPYADYTADRLLAFLSKCELARDIGSKYEYSNLGAGLLGYALAQRAGTSYEKLVVDRICQPLVMKDTSATLNEQQRARLAQGHVEGQPTSNWDLQQDSLAGAGALRSTARDMTLFLQANMGLKDSPLSKSLRASHERQAETSVADLSVGLGWHVWTKHGATIVWHNGGTGGYHSFCGFNPQKKLGVVVLTNSTEDIDDIGLHMLEPKFELKSVKPAVTVDAALLDEYVGYYELQPGVRIHVTRDGGQLLAQVTGQDKYPVFAESPTKFAFRVVDAQISFGRGADGKVDHLTLHQNGDHKARKLVDYKPPAQTEVKVDPKILATYVGKYQLAPNVFFDVQVEGDQLKIKLADQPRWPVFAESETKFFYKVVEAQITFVKDAGGKVTSLILHQGGRDQTAKKIE